MAESDTILDTESGANPEVRAAAEVGAREQPELLIEGATGPEGAGGGVRPKNPGLPC